MNFNSSIAKELKNPSGGIWGNIVTAIMNRQNIPLYEATLSLLKPNDSDNILDIGCGNGYVMNMLAKRCSAKMVGIDISESALKNAYKRNKQFVNNCRMSFETRHAEETFTPDNTFSKAYTINTVYFWSDLKTTMQEIMRVLKPGGLFINTLYSNETLARLPFTRYGYVKYSLDQLTSAYPGVTAEVIPVMSGAAYCLLYRKD